MEYSVQDQTMKSMSICNFSQATRSMRPIYQSSVEVDDIVREVTKSLDYVFTGESTFEGWDKPEVPKDYGIGLIVGPSGSGKSLLLRQFGKELPVIWSKTKAVISHFSTMTEGHNHLMAVGFGSVPSWCRPYHVLSTGE